MYCRKCGKYIEGRRAKTVHMKECGNIVSSVRKLIKNGK